MEENTLKHLEFLQSNISRMSQCSFQIKGLEIAILAALLAIYAASIGRVSGGNPLFILITVIPTVIFWILDSYYLSKEKDYRELYNCVAGLNSTGKTVDLFCLDTHVLDEDQTKIIKTMFTPTEFGLYGLLTIGLILFSIIIKVVF